jgi:hypothetical protein
MSAPAGDEAPEYADVPFCEHPHCHDRVHGDGTHTDEHGRPFTGDTPDWPDDEPDPVDDEDLADDEPEPAVTEPPRPFPLTPIYDQLVTEHAGAGKATST